MNFADNISFLSGIKFDEVRMRLLFYERHVNFIRTQEHGLAVHQAFAAST